MFHATAAFRAAAPCDQDRDLPRATIGDAPIQPGPPVGPYSALHLMSSRTGRPGGAGRLAFHPKESATSRKFVPAETATTFLARDHTRPPFASSECDRGHERAGADTARWSARRRAPRARTGIPARESRRVVVRARAVSRVGSRPEAAGDDSRPSRGGGARPGVVLARDGDARPAGDRKSTRLNSSHVAISYAVFCL